MRLIRQEPFTQANGRMVNLMASARCTSLTAQSILVHSVMAMLLERGGIFMQTARTIKAKLKIIKLKVKEHSKITMLVIDTWANGRRTCLTGKVQSSGRVEFSTMGRCLMALNTAWEDTPRLMEATTKGSLVTTSFIPKVCTDGQTEELTRAIGSMEECTDSGCLNGLTVIDTKAGMKTARNKAKGSFFGVMAEFMTDSG